MRCHERGDGSRAVTGGSARLALGEQRAGRQEWRLVGRFARGGRGGGGCGRALLGEQDSSVGDAGDRSGRTGIGARSSGLRLHQRRLRGRDVSQRQLRVDEIGGGGGPIGG